MTGTDPLFDLTGLAALVTGSRRGLGREIVRAFASHGDDVVVSRKIEACEEACEEVRAMGRRALAYSAHVERWDQIDALIGHVYAEFGKVDILVNNAGTSPRAPSHEVTEKLFASASTSTSRVPSVSPRKSGSEWPTAMAAAASTCRPPLLCFHRRNRALCGRNGGPERNEFKPRA
jgi:NAD(P)-dependent dehydrogenase (short-subunit alcohol dehydrogenase family)